MAGTWRPAHRAGSTVGCLVSNQAPQADNKATYTFGHFSDPGSCKTAKQDNSAAAWWAPGAAPSTNAAANGDVQAFWSASAPDPAASIRRLTGRDTAAAVKTAGRGSHIQLGSAGGSFAHSSNYRDAFCSGGAAGAAGGKGGAAAQYTEAVKAARANRALGTGASLNLAQMW